MDISEKKEKRVNPAEKGNPLSLLTFVYMFPIFKQGFKNDLNQEDLFRPLKEHKSSILGEKLEKIWRQEYIKHKKYALHRALFKLFGRQFIWFGVLKLFNEVMMVILPPFSIGRLISYYQNKNGNISETEAYLQALAVVLCLVLNALLSHPTLMGLMHMTMKMRLSCSSLIYRKMLRLSQKSLGATSVGQLVNLLSNDVSKFDEGFLLAHYVWIGPIHAAVGTYFLYRQIGVSAFFGIAFLISFIPIQLWLGKRTSVLRLRTALRTDERVRLTNEIISGIQVIKMYCWEKPFEKLVSLARKSEMSAIRNYASIRGLFQSFETFATRTSIFLSILGYVLLGSHITAEKVFTMKAIYDVLRSVLILHYSISASAIAETSVSLSRIQKFLAFEEQEIDEVNEILKIEPKISFQNVYAKWTEESPDNTLKGINLDVSSDQVLAVIGPVGSGKSSLFGVLLKELSLQSGRIDINGKISYSAQEPWLFSASVRQNILFNNEYHEDRYRQVVEVCALSPDFKSFPFGDRTLVGEKGRSLSGGQKARINLARCIYNEADIYLLDDPLSAVDANVGKHLYDKCIKGFLRGKICVLITHQLQYLSSADRIVVMKEGRIEMEGKYEELKTEGLDFAKLLKEFHNEEDTSDDKRDEEIEEEVEDEDEEPTADKEQMKKGSVRLSLYFDYFRAGGGVIMMIVLAVLFLGAQLAASAGDYYVTYWVNLEQDNVNNTLDREPIIYTYSGIILGTIVFAMMESLYFMFYFTLVSINLHHLSFSKLMSATMRFYNNNPSGRILNRFSKDLGSIDGYVPSVLFDVIQMTLMLIGSFVISFIVYPWLLIPSVFLLAIFYFVRIIYMRTSRSVKRIEGITRSPIYGHMTTSVQGLSTIRASSAQKILTKEFDDYQDNHSAAWFLFIAANRCFGFWVDLICIVFLAVSVFALMYFSNDTYGGDIGLVITQYTTFISSLQWELRQLSELENNMISVERLLEYKNIESEPVREKTDLPPSWPKEGKIEFRDVNLKYSSDSSVLKNLNFVIYPGEKVGIVGRTGAGKSSTITALFQLYPIEGSIVVDDVDTTTLILSDVRSRISIIPQEPVLFSGTLRKNLDPFEEYPDETLWNALEQVKLKGVIADQSEGLLSKVSEGGSNFSVGQRQLICLARALLRKNKILVMDEATANVDPQTDAVIQNTIREKFGECTVLTVAHRLHTVMDSDRIMVMDAGSVQEFDHPYNLLKKEEGILRNLVQNTGKGTAQNLENIAKMSYERIKIA